MGPEVSVKKTKKASTGPARLPQAQWRPSKDLVLQRVDDGIILVQLGSDRIYALNTTGARVWELVAKGCTPDEIKRRLASEFRVAPTRLNRDLAKILASLEAQGLVERKRPRKRS